jgi:hypothetical protein
MENNKYIILAQVNKSHNSLYLCNNYDLKNEGEMKRSGVKPTIYNEDPKEHLALLNKEWSFKGLFEYYSRKVEGKFAEVCNG